MSFSTKRFRLAALLSASALVVSLAACDSDDTTDPDADEASSASEDDAPASDSGIADDPESALKDAVAAMADWDGVALQMSFQVDDAARASILEEEPEDEELLDTVLNSSATMIVVGDEDDGAMQLSVTVDGTDLFEMYVAATDDEVGAFAIRVDLPAIMDMVDDPMATAEIDAMIGQAAMFGLEDAANALAEGEWVSLAGLNELSDMMEDFAPSESPDVDDEQAEQAAEALAARTERFIDEDVQVSHVGSDAAGERLRIVAPGPALESYLDDVVGILAANDLVDGLGADELQGELDDFSAEDMTLDVWISGGEVSQFALDLTQLEDEDAVDREFAMEGEFLLVVGLSNHTGGLSAPSAATTIDVMSIFGQFMGGMGDMGGFGEFDDDDFLDEDGGFDDAGMSEADIEMMLSFMECITEEELESFEIFMPELVDAAEQALADGTLEYC